MSENTANREQFGRSPSEAHHIPHRCPGWCQGLHDVWAAEMDNDADHYGVIPELHFHEYRSATGDVLRDGGSSANVTLTKSAESNFSTVLLHTSNGLGGQCVLTVTPAEARSLAAQLVTAAEAIEIGRGL
jgi:hypothetical protein